MLEYLPYITFFTVLILFILFLYIRLKFGFWAVQPVFHVYDFTYMIKPPGIINHDLPEKNKYTNFKNIETLDYDSVSELKQNKILNLIKYNYLQNKNNIFSPTQKHITPYFYGHNSKSFVSIYNEDDILTDIKTNVTLTEKKIIGIITSRPIHILINNKDNNAKFTAYYVDYLCVDKLFRKKGIAQQLIQTHQYNQSYLNKNIVVSLFKREEELTGIVPLCVYSTYGFHVNTWTKPQELLSNYKLLEINSQNLHYLTNFISENAYKFDILIQTEVTNIIELIKTKNIFIYVILVDDAIICAYFFRKSCVQIDTNIEILSCFASINNTDDNVFIQGFKISFWKIASENYFGFSAIENISHNDIIINNIIMKTKPLIISPTAYFFYNFAYPTFKSNSCLIIN